MPQKVLRFTGINRKVNEFQNSGACEELINLRPETSGGLRVVRGKYIKEENVQYKAYYVHSFGGTTNHIAVTYDGVVMFEDKNIAISSGFAGRDIEICSAGNVLLLYCKQDGSQEAYKYKNDTYEKFDFSASLIKEVNVVPSSYNLVGVETQTSGTLDKEGFNDALNRCIGEFYHKYPKGLCGTSVIGCTYEMEDGNEVWATAFVVADVAKMKDYSVPSATVTGGVGYAYVFGYDEVYLNLKFDNTVSSGLKRINVYASKPLFGYSVKDVKQGTIDNPQLTVVIERDSLKDMGLDGQLMYFQKSIDPNMSNAIVELNFGSTQAGEQIMNVNSGCVERVGEVFSYNNRFHYYGGYADHVIQRITQSRIDFWGNNVGSTPWVAYIKTDKGWVLLDGIYNIFESQTQDFIYPMSGVSKLAFVMAVNNGSYSVPYKEMFYVEMNDSTAYNYSYAFDVKPKIESASKFYEEVSEYYQTWDNKYEHGFDRTYRINDESNVLNVSEPYNPYAFQVKYSYSFGGEIKDITPSYLPISSTQVGQYPLTVFTTSGIYSMEQGGGDVLYSNIVPIQPLVITGKATPTPYGTFFVSSRSLYMLSGREAANLSYVLNGQRELGIRDTKAYKQICLAEGGTHDLSDIISTVNFEEFIEDAVLVYDQLHNELHIGSVSDRTPYSYVLNLDSKAYYKRDSRFLAAQNGARYVIEKGRSNCNVVDLHKEKPLSNQRILLQSRPFSLDAFFTHIQRLIMLTDANLSNLQTLFLSVFASDDLNNWKCIISSQKTNTVLRQIRTNRAAKSYRDYIVVISGYVDSNTDLSDIIADYSVVSRRLG